MRLGRFGLTMVLIGAVRAVLATACAAAPIPFNVGESAPANTYLPMWMAQDAGFYAAHGLAMNTVEMVGGRDMGPAFASGQLQAMHIGLSSVIRADAAGAHIKAVASVSNVIRFTMFARPEIRTAADLKGGVVGISSTGSESDATITLAMKKLGLSRSDITVKELGTIRVPALLRGEVVATSVNEPERSQAFALGLNPLVDFVKDQTPWVFSGLVVDQTYLETHRELVTAFLQATAEGNRLALSDPVRAKAVLARQLKLTDGRIVDLSYDDFVAQSPRDLEISLEGARNNIEAVAPPGASREVSTYLDTSLIDGLRAGGFFRELDSRYPARAR